MKYMNLKSYVDGDGIDVSKRHILEGHKHYFIEPDNFYSLKEVAKPESLDFVYSKDLINGTKFYRVLIKEWFYACKIKGKIIIEMQDNEILSFKDLINEIKILIGDKSKLIEKEYDDYTREGVMVIEKIKPVLNKADSIGKWTFGILTNGKRDDVVDKTIKSIIDLKISHYEILICGEYSNKPRYKIRNLGFNTEIPWITKKKNFICEEAKYENIVVMHDRYIFDKNWYEGMKKYGNYFEILSCVIKDGNGKRTDDWVTFGSNLNDKVPYGNQGWLEYRDWDKNGYIDGGFYILKKDVWRKVKWDNSLMWNQGEDIALARDFYNAGFVARFNPFSSCVTISTKYKWPIFEFDLRILGRKRGERLINRIKLEIKSSKRLKRHYYVMKDIYLILKKNYGGKQ